MSSHGPGELIRGGTESLLLLQFIDHILFCQFPGGGGEGGGELQTKSSFPFCNFDAFDSLHYALHDGKR